MKHSAWAYIATIVALSFAICFCVAEALPSSTLSEELQGWNKAKWGMTEDDVLAAFKGEAILLKKPYKYVRAYASIEIDSVMIRHHRFAVRFLFDDITKKLRAVNLHLKEDNPLIKESAFSDMEQALTEKYGKPTYQKDKSRRTGSHKPINKESTWKMAKTYIILSLMADSIMQTLIIQYKPW